ncbi:hypothetical protein [Acidovorax temperans]|uniref:hypothetical protein n=1 Tax=Acidovorax temperans TaxID=80878 RepID=UPI00289F9DD7|nr:hypothetical protein [Acidovorax temperans]
MTDIAHLFGSSIGVLLALLIGAFGAMIPILKDWAESNWRKRFKEQLGKAIANEKLEPEDLGHLAERWNQDRRSVLSTLRSMLAESISGEIDTLKDKSAKLRELIKWHSEREPFAELPENIGLQLNTMKTQFPASASNIGQLATSMSELYSSNKADLKKQKLYSFWGFLVGILGLLLSVASLYLALPTKG